MSEEVIDRDAILRAAVEEHRRALEALAAGTARVEEIDAKIAELQVQRAQAVAEVEQLHADLTSGRSAGEAIAALGLKVARSGGRGAKPARRSAKRGAARVNSRKQAASVGAAPQGDSSTSSSERLGA
ncbi:hypothetical protein [Mycolicibacterium mageritense]|uniref:hypothetical protein n=1 Tax=Mycolicibacterium mageritense TaxID=53462 RepID=UPI0011DBAB08|nr:hypothetical protein [Mycolicibacterium mageritense]TXI56467.1 MAG: hypothetical protein E6Q55_28795 [Mycolicibacterium mageritense]